MAVSYKSFDPRIGTAQLIFGVIYTLITMIALSLAFYVRAGGDEPYLHYFMAVLFALLALKSFVISSRIRKLIQNGIYYEAHVDSCEPVRGITILRGVIDVEEHGLIYIESRLAGEKIAHEINQFLADHKQDKLPALVVASKTNPRGMFTVRSLHGHLVPESATLKSAQENAVDQSVDESLSESTAKAKEMTKAAERQRQEEDAADLAENTDTKSKD